MSSTQTFYITDIEVEVDVAVGKCTLKCMHGVMERPGNDSGRGSTSFLEEMNSIRKVTIIVNICVTDIIFTTEHCIFTLSYSPASLPRKL